MATITTFSATSHISYYSMETGLGSLESFSFESMPSPNISNLAKAIQDILFLS